MKALAHPLPCEQRKGPQTYDDLVAEAEAMWTEDAVAEASKGIPPAMWPYRRADFIATHIKFHMTDAIRADRRAKAQLTMVSA